MPGCRIVPLAAAVAFLAVGTGVAVAQGDGAQVAPDSPAGKEYALPLDSARREAAGDAAPTPGDASGAPPPLFGAGITPSGESRRVEQDGGEGAQQGDAEQAPDEEAAIGRADSTQAARAAATGSEGLSPALLTLLIGLGVVLVGALVGLAVRAVRSGNSPG